MADNDEPVAAVEALPETPLARLEGWLEEISRGVNGATFPIALDADTAKQMLAELSALRAKLPNEAKLFATSMQLRQTADVVQATVGELKLSRLLREELDRSLGRETELRRRAAALQILLDMKDPWCLREVFEELTRAAKILMQEKSYDGHGWERIDHALRKHDGVVAAMLQAEALFVKAPAKL